MGGCVMGPRKRAGALSGENPEPERKARSRFFRSITARLTAFALLISILPVVTISSLMTFRMEKMIESELQQSYGWLVREHLSHVEEKLRQYENSLLYTSRNTTILENLTGDAGDAYLRGKAISNEVFKSVPMEDHQEVRNCIVYSMVEESPVYGSHAAMFTAWDDALWRKKGWDGGQGWYLNRSWDGRWLLSLIYPVVEVDVQGFTASRQALLKLDLYLDRLVQPYSGWRGSVAEDYQLVLADADGGLLYATRSGLDQIAEEWMQSGSIGQMQSFGAWTVQGEQVLDYGMSLIYLFDNHEMIAQRSALKRMVYPMVLLLTLVIIAVAYLFFRSFSSRVNLLVEKFRRAGEGDLSPTPPIGGEDELAVLDDRFGRMLVRMDEMTRRSIAQQTEIREAQYRNLQLQINPHFLYNTLETISAIGAMHQAFQVCELCEKLGDLFRYSLGKNEGRLTTVASEIRQTRNYIFIQQVRYQFEAYYSVEVDAEDVYMPRFLLQPIVENSVLHGLAGKNGAGTLEVYVGRREEFLSVRISDDGVGMDAEQLEALRARMRDTMDRRENGSNIGVWNICQRIRLLCGDDYGVEVYSRPGQGTTFLLKLPFITKGMIENDPL